jgi:hypothetical protein
MVPISQRPLSALLSQVLVAFTVEFDGEFERRMGEAGYAGARLSLALWTRMLRFVGSDGLPVRDLTARMTAPVEEVRLKLGCLERWGFITMQPGRRDGWGSGRGIRGDWTVRLTTKGAKAAEIWPPLFPLVEGRWETRFGSRLLSLRQALQTLAGAISGEDVEQLPLASLFDRLLRAFRLEFDRQAVAPLDLSANILRVLGSEPVREAEIPRLTGGSPETSGIGWQVKRYIVIEPDPSARRGKLVLLSPLGIKAQHDYQRLTAEIEQRWEADFGANQIRALRESLQTILTKGDLLADALTPPAGTARAGDQAPALGRRDVGVAARKRMRDLIVQTEAFRKDPAGALPHYPLWDMNRGFGP